MGIEILVDIMSQIYNTGQISEELYKVLFIILPKKITAKECDDYRTISLIRHTLKILLKIILQRIRRKVKNEISKAQFGFMSGRGTRNAIFVLRMLVERCLEVKKDLYFCFIDIIKAFDNVKHEQLLTILATIGVDGKDRRVISNIYK